MKGGELTGVRVLDVSTLYPAPLLAAMLGDFGADVVKVESPDGDPLRAMGAGPWSVAGRNKRSVVVDVDSDDGLSRLHRLIDASDVTVFNQPAGVRERWQCTDDALTARSPHLIVVHVSAFGTTGPYASRPGNGTLAEAFIGLPAGGSVALGDTFGAVTGVARVIAALYARDHGGGRGQVVDVALYEAMLPLLGPALAGVRAGRMVRDRHIAGDGRTVAIAATTAGQMARLDDVAGTDVAAWVQARSSADAVDLLLAARVPAVIVNDLEMLQADPHVAARGSLDIPGSAAPVLGEHTVEVVREWLHEGRA